MGSFDSADLLPFLGTFSLFAGLPADLLQEVGGKLHYLDLSAGQALLRQGEPGDALYLIVDGCFEARLEYGPGAPRVLGAVGRGALVGEMAVISGNPRSCSMYAVRESGALRLTQTDFQRILEHHPRQMFRLTTEIIRRAAAAPQQRTPGTIALLPLGPSVDLDALAPALTGELGRYRDVRLMTKADAARQVGAIEGDGLFRDQRLLHFLSDEEHRHELVVYQAEPEICGWTRRCLAQADLVLLVADARDGAAPRPAEDALLWQRQPITEAPIELLILHPQRRQELQGTRRFLSPRPRLRLHHHVARDTAADLQRLARLLTGNGVQLVLSGGGARAFCHIGALRALEECGVPVDFVGGASMGGFIGALCAMEWGARRIQGFAQDVLKHSLMDLTLPLLSLIRGQKGTRLARSLFGDRRIEDLWINYFAMSADLCSGDEVVHREGPIWEAIRATVSIPGLIPPVTEGGRCLVDGGVLNNMPTDVMARLYGGTIIAVDATQDRLFEPPAPLPLDVTGWRLLLRRMSPSFGADLHIGDVLMRSAEIASTRISRGAAGKDRVALTLRPPVQRFRMLDFRPVDAIAELGYRDALERVARFWAGRSAPG